MCVAQQPSPPSSSHEIQPQRTAHTRHQVCGVAGSPWKMYISPVHAIMILHNIETNEEIWDYKATTKDLERVVRDNIVELEGIAAKEKAVEERKAAWENLLENRLKRHQSPRLGLRSVHYIHS